MYYSIWILPGMSSGASLQGWVPLDICEEKEMQRHRKRRRQCHPRPGGKHPHALCRGLGQAAALCPAKGKYTKLLIPFLVFLQKWKKRAFPIIGKGSFFPEKERLPDGWTQNPFSSFAVSTRIRPAAFDSFTIPTAAGIDRPSVQSGKRHRAFCRKRKWTVRPDRAPPAGPAASLDRQSSPSRHRDL